MAGPHVCFEILHYIDLEMTLNCVRSIEDSITYENYSIVIVDNASPNKSGLMLQERLCGHPRVTVLLLEENIGFAKGNNVGYRYAKEKNQADYIIACNNDLLFDESFSVETMMHITDLTGCYLLGPDILVSNGQHRSPINNRLLTESETRKAIRVRRVYLMYYCTKKHLHINDKIKFLEKRQDLHKQNARKSIAWENTLENVVLHGACIIYTPAFVSKEDEAFLPDTFMYGEEALLALMCRKKNYKIIYSPELRVTHVGSAISKQLYQNLEKRIFVNRHQLYGLKLYLKYLKS